MEQSEILQDNSSDSQADNSPAVRHNIALLVEYDGTPFCGWQSQKNGDSIQDALQNAIYKLTGENVRLNGCSRTDAGVHALGHVSNFISATRIPIDKIPIAMNSHLPLEIAVKKAVYVDKEFHARFDAVGKRYRYSIWNDATRSALNRSRAYHAPRPICIEAMEQAAEKLIGTKDFSSFMASGSVTKSTIRTLHQIDVIADNPWIHLVFYGDGFLYNMVRILAGTLYYVGIGKLCIHDMEGIVDSRDRTKAGKTLPSCGLTLEKVFYKKDLFVT